MNPKHYLVISGIVGGVIGSLLTALLISPVTANEASGKVAKFYKIQCSVLEFVDVDSKLQGWLYAGEDVISIVSDIDILGNIDAVGNTIGCSKLEVGDPAGVIIGSNEQGGYVFTYHKDFNNGDGNQASVGLLMSERSGQIYVRRGDGSGRVVLSTTEHGGIIDVDGKDGESQVRLTITEHGGGITVAGRSKGVALMAIGPDGDGYVGALDKNGYEK